jgi:hypothetical protein
MSTSGLLEGGYVEPSMRGQLAVSECCSVMSPSLCRGFSPSRKRQLAARAGRHALLKLGIVPTMGSRR